MCVCIAFLLKQFFKDNFCSIVMLSIFDSALFTSMVTGLQSSYTQPLLATLAEQCETIGRNFYRVTYVQACLRTSLCTCMR